MFLRESRRPLALLCAIEACGVIGVSEAVANPGGGGGDVLFNNFGPNNSYEPSAGAGFGGSNPHFEQAMAFTTEDTYLLTSGEFGVTLSFGLNPSTFQISVHADAAGLPGTVLEQVTVTTDLGPFGQLSEAVAVDFGGQTLLNSGEQFWISMTAGEFTQAVWNRNNIGDLGPRAFRNNFGPWTLTSNTDTRSAFRLHGTVVPGPGSIGLLGVIALGARRRRGVRDDS